MEQAQVIQQQLQCALVNREETRICYNAITHPQTKYPLPTNIQGRFHPMSLSKMGINRNMPKVVVSGPTTYGGLDIRELWTIQGVEATTKSQTVSYKKKT